MQNRLLCNLRPKLFSCHSTVGIKNTSISPLHSLVSLETTVCNGIHLGSEKRVGRHFSTTSSCMGRPYPNSRKQHHVSIELEKLQALSRLKNKKPVKVFDQRTEKQLRILWNTIKSRRNYFIQNALFSQTEREVLREVIDGAKFYEIKDIEVEATKIMEEIEGREANSRRGKLIFVTLIKSPAHQPDHVSETVKKLRLRKIHQTEVHIDTPSVRGMCYACRHLLSIKIVGTEKIFPNEQQEQQQYQEEQTSQQVSP